MRKVVDDELQCHVAVELPHPGKDKLQSLETDDTSVECPFCGSSNPVFYKGLGWVCSDCRKVFEFRFTYCLNCEEEAIFHLYCPKCDIHFSKSDYEEVKDEKTPPQ